MKRSQHSIFLRRARSCLIVALWSVTTSGAATPRLDRLGDPLPEGALARLGTMRLRHAGEVRDLAFAPDGQTLASAGTDGAVHIWETATGRQRYCLRRDESDVDHVAYSPDGKLLAAAGSSGLVLWDPIAGTQLAQLGKPGSPAGPVVFSPDGKTIAVVTADVTFWDARTGVRLRQLDLPEKADPPTPESVKSLAYSPDGKTLAYVHSNEVGLCAADTDRIIRKYLIREAVSVAFAPDGVNILVSQANGWILLNAKSGKIVKKWEGEAFAKQPVFAPNGRFIAWISEFSRTPVIWDVNENKEFEFPGVRRYGDWFKIVCSPDSKRLASSDQDGRVHLWDVAARKEIELPAGDANGFGFFALTRDGKTLAALDGHHCLRLCNTADAKLQWPVRTLPKSPFDCLALSPDGLRVAAPGEHESHQSTIQILDAATGRRYWSAKAEGLGFAAFSPDGKRLATGRGNHVIDLWDAASGKSLGFLRDHTATVVAGLFSPDGKTLATGSADGTARLWDVEGQRQLHCLLGHGGGTTVLNLAFSANGQFLASGGDDGRICVWDVATGRRLHRWAIDEEDGITCLALSLDGKTLLTNAGKGKFRLWDVARETAGPIIAGHGDTITFAAFLSDGATLMTAGCDGTALLWDRAALAHRRAQEVVARIDAHDDPLPPQTLTRLGSVRLQHREMIGCAAFSPDGKILATAASSDELEGLRLWDVASGKELHQLPRGRKFHADEVVFSPDGKLLATRAWDDHAVHLWDVASGRSLGKAVWTKEHLTAFAFTPDGKALASGKEMIFLETNESITGFSPDGCYLLTSMGSLWDMRTGRRSGAYGDSSRNLNVVAFSPDGRLLATGGTDHTILVQPAPRGSRPRLLVPCDLSKRELQECWANLSAADPSRAWQAMCLLQATPQQSISFLQTLIRPQSPRNLSALDHLLADLDSDAFLVREQARIALGKFGDLAEPALERTLARTTSLEVRRQVETLLEQIHHQSQSPQTLRALRALTILEHSDTTEAETLLRQLATGAAEARQTREAAAALQRRTRRTARH